MASRKNQKHTKNRASQSGKNGDLSMEMDSWTSCVLSLRAAFKQHSPLPAARQQHREACLT